MKHNIPAISLSREELNQLVVDYQRTNDNDLLEKIICAMIKFCSKCAYKYCDIDSYRDDCISEGIIGIINAARLYDTTQMDKVCFMSYAGKAVVRTIWRYLSEFRYHSDRVSSIDEPIFTDKQGKELFLKDILVDDTFKFEGEIPPGVEDVIVKISVFMDKYFSEKAISIFRNKFGFNASWPMPDKENAKAHGMTYNDFIVYYKKCLNILRKYLILGRTPAYRV